MEGFDGNFDLTCENCRFFALDHKETSGDCRRYAPKPMSFADTEDFHTVDIVWPQMSLDDWCGEFQPHPITAERRKQWRERRKEHIAEFVRQNYPEPPPQ
jgi:hypothetical protein